MISLQFHEVRITVELEDAVNIPGIDATFNPQVTLWADYIFLEQTERAMFVTNEMHYLVEQTQIQRDVINVKEDSVTNNYTLNFNHPVKYIAAVLKPPVSSHGVFSGSGSGLEYREFFGPIADIGLQIDGSDRFAKRKGSYFRLHHPLRTFGQAPSVGIYVYSFALRPKSRDPTSTLNMSRIDEVRLSIRTKAARKFTYLEAYEEDETSILSKDLKAIEVYARNFNILRVKDGMAGMLFMN